MASTLLSTGALLLMVSGPLVPTGELPTQETLLKVCQDYAGPKVMASNEDLLAGMSPEKAQAYLDGRLLEAMRQHGVHAVHFENTNVVCSFYINGATDAIGWVQKTFLTPEAKAVARAGP